MSSSDRTKSRIKPQWPIRLLTIATSVYLAFCFTPSLARPAGSSESPRPDEPAMASRVQVPEPTPAAVDYHYSGLTLWFLRQFWVIAVPMVWIASRASERIRSRLPSRSAFSLSLCFALSYYTITSLVNLPWSFYLGFVRAHDYGLSTQPIGDFVADELKSTALSLALFVAVVTGLYVVIRRWPQRWWIAAGLAVLPLMLVLALIVPVWVDPLFHEYGSMSDQALEAQIVALAERAGVDGSRVYEVDMSRETRALNAYVTGLLDTKRIVLWDTLLARLQADEVLAVMAHEIGHYALGHVLQGLAVAAGLTFLGLAFVAAAIRQVIPRFTGRFGISRLDDPASLPVLILLAQLASFALTPVGYAFSRHIEHEADRFALEITHDNHAAARAFVALQRENLGFPRPSMLHTFFRSTHPSLGERIDFCNSYRPWSQNQPSRYAALFRSPPPAQSSAAAATLAEPR